MSTVKINIVANYFSNIWIAIMTLVFVPIYIHFLGIEAYGLIGIFTALQGMFALMDMGLSATLNRELARLSVQSDEVFDMGDVVRTLEIIYWVVALVLGMIVIVISGAIVSHWINADTLNPNTIKNAIIIMGIIIVFRWPLNLYYGGLNGLQRQIVTNSIKSGTATLGGIGAILILWFISPTIEAFFIWQVFISLLQITLARYFLWTSIPKKHKHAKFKIIILKNIWSFASGITVIMIIDVILKQLDKIILSKMLTLEMFGYYSLATAVAMSLFRIIAPIFDAVYPKLTNLVVLDNQIKLAQLYHKSCQLMSVVIIPISLLIVFFSKDILLIWTQDLVIANHTYLLLSILIIGTTINGLTNIPFALQLANEWTSLTLKINIASLIIFTPYIIIITKYFGAVGGATSWVLIHLFQIIININFMHRRLLHREKGNWLFKDIGLPFLSAFLIISLGFILIRNLQLSQIAMLFSLFSIYSVSILATIMITPEIRNQFYKIMHKTSLFY